MAKLYFRYGAMNSGKSTALMQVAHNYEEQGMQVLILKPQVDTKGGGELVSRLGVHRKADRLIRPDMDVFEVVREASQATKLACVLCDESQFFTAEQAEQLFMVTVDLNIPVICYGLRADFSLRGFPGSTRLLELAHTIEEMKTICTCGRKAICNCRKVNGQFVFEGEQVAIDLENDVQYVSMCPQCYFRARRAFYAACALPCGPLPGWRGGKRLQRLAVEGRSRVCIGTEHHHLGSLPARAAAPERSGHRSPLLGRAFRPAGAGCLPAGHCAEAVESEHKSILSWV